MTGRVVHADGTPAAEVEVTGGWGVQGLAGAGPAQPGLEEREVTRCEEEATTDGDGAFAIDGLPAAGRVRLSTTRLTPFGSATVGCEPRECVLGGGPVLLTLVAPGSCRVRLRLVDEVGTPLEGAVVHWLGARQERGAFVVDTFRPGPVRLEVSADGRCGRTLDAVVQAGQLLDLGDVRLERAGSLSLSVRWPAAPLADVQVALQTGAGPTETQEPRVPELACEPIVLEGLTPGPTTVRLTARRPDGGRYTAVASASVVAGEAARVELDLRAAPLLPPGEGR